METTNTTMTETAKLVLKDQEYDLPVITGSEGEIGIDINELRKKTTCRLLRCFQALAHS